MPDAAAQATESKRDSPVVALLLAAGESTRMGQPKPLLNWDGRTLMEYQVAQLLSGGVDHVIAVLGHHAEQVLPFARRAGATPVINTGYRDGRSGSVRVGAEAAPDGARAIVILNVDQPRPGTITRAVLSAHLREGNLITVPAYRDRRGHPAALSGSLLAELRQVEEATEGLRAVMLRHAAERRQVDIDDPSVVLDMNTPDDYERARTLLARGPTSEF